VQRKKSASFVIHK